MFKLQSDPDTDEESVVHQNWQLASEYQNGVVSIFYLFMLFASLLACNWQWLTQH